MRRVQREWGLATVMLATTGLALGQDPVGPPGLDDLPPAPPLVEAKKDVLPKKNAVPSQKEEKSKAPAELDLPDFVAPANRNGPQSDKPIPAKTNHDKSAPAKTPKVKESVVPTSVVPETKTESEKTGPEFTEPNRASRLPPKRTPGWNDPDWPSKAPSLPPAKVVLEAPRPIATPAEMPKSTESPVAQQKRVTEPTPTHQNHAGPAEPTQTQSTATNLEPLARSATAEERAKRAKRRPSSLRESELVPSSTSGSTSSLDQTKPAATSSSKPVASTPLPVEEYEIVVPTIPQYDVVNPTGRVQRGTAEYEEGVIRRDDSIVRASAEGVDSQPPTVRTYPVKLWSVDGWETYRELARLEYRDPSLADALARFNRSPNGSAQPLRPGSKVRLPPRWVLAGGQANVTRKPAFVAPELAGPPATSVKGLLPGTSVVASSRSTSGKLVNEPTTAEERRRKATEEEGPHYTVVDERMTLYRVAAITLKDGKRKQEIFDLNRHQLSSMDGELKVGTKLRMPKDAQIASKP